MSEHRCPKCRKPMIEESPGHFWCRPCSRWLDDPQRAAQAILDRRSIDEQRIAKGLTFLRQVISLGRTIEEGESRRISLDLGAADGVEALVADLERRGLA